jgi:hypothetical protein
MPEILTYSYANCHTDSLRRAQTACVDVSLRAPGSFANARRWNWICGSAFPFLPPSSSLYPSRHRSKPVVETKTILFYFVIVIAV